MVIVKSVIYLLNSLFAIPLAIIKDKPMYDEDFFNKFKDPKDKAKLDEAVSRMKNGTKNKSETIYVNDEEITIVAQ